MRNPVRMWTQRCQLTGHQHHAGEGNLKARGFMCYFDRLCVHCLKCVGNGRRVRCIEQLLVADAQGADSDALRIFIKRDLEFVLHFEFGNKKAPTSGA